jgi:hypothetical protein
MQDLEAIRMKLSEAIRKGSKGKVQLKGQWIDHKNGVCAIGAAMVAVNTKYHYAGSMTEVFPQLITRIEGKTLYEAIVERNDNGQTFEQIITWLESIGQ